ncbi:hypothetical protein APSETT445_006904 [Aspergillus pseudonomiae]
MSHAANLTPVVIGVGDIKNTSVKPEHAYEPIELMIQAITAAADDSSVPRGKIIPAVDSIDVVANWTWPYPNAAQLLAERLGVKPVHQYESGHGGNAPAKLFDEAARRVSKGECRLAVVTGGEALASYLGTLHSIGLPIQVYPLYEAGLRAHRKQTYDDNHQESAQLYANFAEIAATNPVAWNHGRAPATIDSIATITKKNRMICSPYPLLMNAFNNVNMAAACIVTSVDFARQLGVPESRWIYPLGGAGTSDASSFWERHNFHSSPSIANSLDEALRVSGLTKEDIDIYDFYSYTYTVDFQRNGSPGQGYVVGRLESGQRFIANAANAATLKQLSSTAVEQIGRTGWVLNDAESSRNLFSFEGPHI